MAFRPVQFLTRLRKGPVLLAGFTAVMIVLILSAIEGLQIQQRAHEQTVDIYHRHLHEEEMLDRFRSYFSSGGTYARDFLLSRRPDRVATYRKQLAQLKANSQQTLQELRQFPALQSTPTLEAELQEFWDVLDSIAGWSDQQRAEQGYDFVQQQIVSRRDAAGKVALALSRARQNALQSKEVEFRHARNSAFVELFVILLAGLLLAYAATYISLTRSRELEQETAAHYDELVRAKRDLERLSMRLLEVQEDERRRIARELHDEIGQTLTALRIEISAAQSQWKAGAPEVPERLERARALADKTVKTVRYISLLLRPSLLDDLGLGPALHWQAEDFTHRTGIPVEFSQEDFPPFLPDAHRTCVYRIVQEALHNCDRHAAASRVRLSVCLVRENLIVEIEDDGRGFDAAPKGAPRRLTGLGLRGMTERAAMLGGIVHIDSSPGAGTHVTLLLPLAGVATSAEPGAGEQREQKEQKKEGVIA
ncbi:MAG TPA: sensor histidine kinase [Bryobacterales bacterium]|nr:sensor histidine kinase [Bryobacterales bacterium]